MAQVKVLVSRGDVRVELEGDQAFVESHLEKLLPMVKVGANGDRAPRQVASDRGGEAHATEVARQTLKSFFKDKSPGNAYEAIAAVLHYKRQQEQKDELSANDIRNALLTAGYRPPGRMPEALTDCRRKYGYIEAGTRKGLWRLSNQGETVVEIDLPRTKAQ